MALDEGIQVTLVTEIPCNSITKKQNETLNVRLNYTYKGPAVTARLGAVVTEKWIPWIAEWVEIDSTKREVYVDLPYSPTSQTYNTTISGLPLYGCEPKSGYGVKVYVLDMNGKAEWGHKSVLTVTEDGAGLQPPEVETLDAQDITPYTATLRARLVETGYWSQVYVFFELYKRTGPDQWGDRRETPLQMLYEGDEGTEFSWPISALLDQLAYRFRVGVIAVGDRSEEMPTQWGAYKDFFTPAAHTLEIYQTKFRHNGSSYTEPQIIEIGDEVGVQFNIQNISGRTVDLQVDLKIYGGAVPIDQPRVEKGTGSSNFKHLQTFGAWISFTADALSTWEGRIILKADGEEVLDMRIIIGYMPSF